MQDTAIDSLRDSEMELRRLLDGIATTTRHFGDALEDAARTSRQSPDRRDLMEQRLSLLDHGLPRMTLADVLLSCEAFATVTGPAALAGRELTGAREEAGRILQALRALSTVPRKFRRTGATAQIPSLQLLALLSDPAVQANLAQLVKLFVQATALTNSERTKKRFVLRIGTRFLVPGSVLTGALTLILFLMGGIAFAIGTVAVTPQGLIVTNPLANPAATATVNARAHATLTPRATATGGGKSTTGTPTPKSTQATSTPRPTSQPSPNAPVLGVAPSTITPCFQQPDQQFVITYSSGQGALTWTATSPDPTNYVLSKDQTHFSGTVTGTLQPGQSVTVYVRLVNDVGTTGQITISGSNGAASRAVTYDSSNC